MFDEQLLYNQRTWLDLLVVFIILYSSFYEYNLELAPKDMH